MRLRPAIASDLNSLIALRLAFLAEARPDRSMTQALIQSTREHFAQRLGTDPSFRVDVAESDDVVIATCTLLINHRLPSFNNPSGREGYLCNVYTVPEHRRKGIAATLVRHAIDAANAAAASKVWLFALPGAQKIYERVGFTPVTHNATEMELRLPDPSDRVALRNDVP